MIDKKIKINLKEIGRICLLWNLGLVVIAIVSWIGHIPTWWGFLGFNAVYIAIIYFSFIKGRMPPKKREERR